MGAVAVTADGPRRSAAAMARCECGTWPPAASRRRSPANRRGLTHLADLTEAQRDQAMARWQVLLIRDQHGHSSLAVTDREACTAASGTGSARPLPSPISAVFNG